ncbi:MAG TPA: efflux RND transporter periplasmic adaptor subunit [Catalimonadaceae bacterium]|jgi:cobalt-zinc-cadmium efflux system membrane fusion protein|nr:efflux RND transporter periplasmic adaptor subunit [Catalimonadaceae bacterium]
MKSYTSIFKAFIFLAFALGGFSSCHQKPAEENKAAFSISDTMMGRCEFSEVVVKEVENELHLFGKIAAENSKMAQVYPIVGGNVVKINVELGDFVRQGQVLAVVRSSEVADFQRQRLDAQSDLALAEKNLQVARDLFESKINSEKEVNAAEKELEKAKAELNRIKEVYSIYNLSKGSIYNITAPITGFIVSKNINQNEQLRSDKSDVIFSIAEIDKVWALANVNESDISKVAIGFEANIQTISYPDKTFYGKVSRIFNAIDPDTKAMKIIVELENKDYKLKPEMNATVSLRYKEGRQLPTIPSASVIFDKNKNWVMVFHSRTQIETRLVEVHRQTGDLTYISSGLKPGEKVISKSGLLIYDALND